MAIITTEMQQMLVSLFCFCFVTMSKLLGAAGSSCTESKCGNNDGLAIHYPFIRGQHCGYDPVLQCTQPHETVVAENSVVLVKFFVKHIDYKHQRIQLNQPDDCLLLKPFDITHMPTSPFYFPQDRLFSSMNITLYHCPTVPVEREYLKQVPCLGGPTAQVYAFPSNSDLLTYMVSVRSCTKMYDVLSLPFGTWWGNKEDFILNWSKPNCTECEAEGKSCRLQRNGTNTEVECVHLKKPSATVGSFVLLLLLIPAYRAYNSDRKETEFQRKIERFLEDYKALKPSRYSYADIKRITNQFKDKIGEGAYGSVFKGNLSSELYVAVKVLKISDGNGEEFINEVETLGHIHHVNVVRLVGFCADGFERALVYDFFPSGSLQDFISSADNKKGFLGWDKLQDVALGIAKGIEYLHQGCVQQILHFDIKPHNVLLDQNLTPKISDFGLAKLCSKDQSIVSMTTARGTMGYVAPEVFSRNFGNVSYKSDVYSYGMVLLEMVGGRKNISSTTENTTEVYYPEWIYSLLEGVDLRIHVGEEADAKIAKRLAIVGLWCIQWHPVDRPSMKGVVQMLEGGEKLTMPPNPSATSGHSRANDGSTPKRPMYLELETITELE
uniref:glycerophosphodiester phosphodiesterase protein kinase domain-containing GDPDL2-like isoform X2 n=1 Tax=Fragaria vesca subsp. vesca TaxID=101020 RepID=UPI0005C886F3|nr:PREDICTED: glycerophosphodiester phosphodiesterase protein kinase domain-containing GDPDL2-like isoform X2 [Fragaria vesca subsp. vesca]